MRSKKGAIELSMTTIIVIVLGVTLLILGLVFVKGIFSKLTSTAEKSFLIADKDLQERIGASEKIYVPGVEFEISPGKSTVFTLGVQNFGEETSASEFRVDVVPGDNSSKKEWFTLPPKQSLTPGDKKGFPVKVTLPKGAPPGKSYTFTIIVYKGNDQYDSQSIIISVKEE